MQLLEACTTRKKKFSIKNFFSKYHESRSFLRIWSHLLKKSLKVQRQISINHGFAKSIGHVKKQEILSFIGHILMELLGKTDNTPFPNLFAAVTCHMKTRPNLVNCKQTDIYLRYLTHSNLQRCVIP